MTKANRTASAALDILIVAAACSSPAWARDARVSGAGEVAGASNQGGLEEVVVTAQRREERVQDIPVAISAFSGEQIEKLGIVSMENIAPRVPSFYFGSFGALRPQLYIRGIGTRSFDPGSESSVGVFADEVYLGRSSGTFATLKDVERVEVLRGPQGTLYGRNTIGGAINVISKGPTPDFEGQVEVGASNFNGYEVFGAVGGPINSSDTVMFRVAGWHTQRDGYVTNQTTGTKFQGVDNTGGRLRLAFEPTDSLSVNLTAEFTQDGDDGGFGGINQGTGQSTTGLPADPNAVFFAPAARWPVNTGDLTSNRLSLDPTLDRETQSYVGRIEYAMSFATLTSVSSYRKLEVVDSRDLEGSPLDVIDQVSHENSEQYTQELRLTSEAGGPLAFGGALDWIIGGFYYKDESDRADSFHLGIDSLVRAAAGTPATDVGLSDYDIESYAVFGQATIHFGEHLDLTLGARYTKDDKKVIQTGTTTDAAPLIAVPFVVPNSASYDSFDPRAVLTYKFNPEVNVYASYSTGFKSGGFQYVPFSAAQASVLFDPEDITAYEIGFKSSLLNNVLRVNAAAYYYDYKDLQISSIILLNGSPVSLITNAAASEVKGLDLEILAALTSNLEVSLTYGYLDGKYKDFVDGQNVDFSDTTMVRAPEHTLNVGAELRVPVGPGELSLRADYALLDDFFHEPGQGEARFGRGIPLTAEDGYGLLDVRVGYHMGSWRVTGYVSNATDEEYRRTVNALTSFVVGFEGQPRTYGVKLAYDF